VVVNRGQARGHALAQAVEGRYEPWESLQRELVGADVVVASTGSEQPIIDVPLMRKVMRRRWGRPVFLVDIAVPRDVDPKVQSLEGAYVYDVDDLQGILRENMQQRGVSAERARLVVDEEVDAFLRWKRARTVTPVIKALTGHTHQLVDHEVERVLARLPELGEEERALIERLGHTIAQKLLHRPLTTLREVAERDRGTHGTHFASAIASLYGLQPEDESEEEDDEA
jgi:glutamyl-tRNA reductase